MKNLPIHYLIDIEEQGYSLVRCELAVFKRAGLGNVHPHKGQDFRLIQDWLGHRDPKHTSRYTRVAARRFEGVWD